MVMLLRPLTPHEAEAVQNAARIVLACYDAALADPKVICPTPLHAALLRLRSAMEGK